MVINCADLQAHHAILNRKCHEYSVQTPFRCLSLVTEPHQMQMHKGLRETRVIHMQARMQIKLSLIACSNYISRLGYQCPHGKQAVINIQGKSKNRLLDIGKAREQSTWAPPDRARAGTCWHT